MRIIISTVCACCLLLCLFAFHKKRTAKTSGNATVITDTLTLQDASRQRPIPIAIYTNSNKALKHKPVVLLSHGYGANQGGDYLKYAYIAEHLASRGCYVVSIQHEIPTDSIIPSTGIPQVVRRSNWERGVVNIQFVLDYLKKTHPGLDYNRVTLIGHSNGGDMSMLFATKYPQLIANVISLDNRRVALPRTGKPKVFSLRSSDQPADEGVLPDEQERKRFGITIVKLTATQHNQMDDDATEAQRREINEYIDKFFLFTKI